MGTNTTRRDVLTLVSAVILGVGAAALLLGGAMAPATAEAVGHYWPLWAVICVALTVLSTLLWQHSPRLARQEARS